ncbi:putative ribonuclease H-like domain-containing protein [Tanacetum coccineum]
MTSCSQAVNKSPTHYPCDSARTFRVILFSIHNDEWKSFQCHHQTALRRPYALSWKPCQGDSLNLPDHSYGNNAQRVNHQNKLTHPHPKRKFVPTAVLTKSGQVPVNAVKQSSPRQTALIILPGLLNTVASKSKGNPQYTLQDQGIFNSGCFRHMTGNKSFLTNYQKIDGGFVAFGGSPKDVKDTRKGKIRTGKLDFEEGGLTCLFAKAIIDESNLWHRRLGHINFKTMNKLVRGNLVRELPSKVFKNDHTCIAYQKGKQHKASCKTKLASSISQPLQMLHMDLFGPTSVRSINHKTYCLIVTDDYSRCDNGTEFKINDMNQFCGMKGIKREFSVARTPQQNGVTERKNRTLIEVARTMLADSLLPTTFWAEAVSTACYVQNRVLVTKPHNKTPYELVHGRPPSISFMPFGCPVTILNTLDPLGKFDEKADEGSGPDWLFDIDLLTNSMNYEPVTIGNQTNKNAGIKDNVDAVPTQQYILLPLLYDSPQSSEDAVADDAGKKTNEEPANKGERNGQEKEGGASNKEDDQNVQDFRAELDNLLV